MKKLSLMFLLLAAGLCFTACGDDSDVPANGYIETTEEGSATFVLKGYESASDGFNLFEAEGLDNSFYIEEKMFTGSAWGFVKAARTVVCYERDSFCRCLATQCRGDGRSQLLGS